MSTFASTRLGCVECDLPPETGFEPDPSVSRCPVCGGTEFELFLDATW